MEQTGQQILEFLRQDGYFVMAPLMIFQGSATTIGAAMLASLGVFSLPVIFLFSVVGDLIGNVALYAIGYHWGIKLTRGWGKKLGLTEARVMKLEKYFHRHGGKAIFIAKPITGIYLATFLTAGIVKMDFRKFLGYSCLSALVLSGVLMLVGYSYGRLWKNQYLDWVGLVILIVTVFSFMSVSFFRKKQFEKFFK